MIAQYSRLRYRSHDSLLRIAVSVSGQVGRVTLRGAADLYTGSYMRPRPARKTVRS